MSLKIPEPLRDLFTRPIVCALATVMPDGQPQVTPVWFDFDGEHIIVNTARGRQKDRNMRRDAKVTLLIIDPENPYHWAEARGVVVEESEAGAHEVIKKLALKYRGREEYTLAEGEVRATYKIAIHKLNGR
ncbi:MAG: PPOX class F420-dependent oxidoreductase [Chloroflexota bacterium]|nr:MAG: PPOX class F420-dependent oxidoreductase [Chloroflexota bacterium]